MNLQKLGLLAIVFCVAWSCSGEKDTYTSASARHAAERYYAQLIAGNYEAFADGIDCDSMPEDLRNEFIVMAAQYADKVKPLSAVAYRDTLYGDSLADVYLTITLPDSVEESTLLPMTFRKGRWFMQ